MDKELPSLDRFATLIKICSSEDLFFLFYKKHLLNKKQSAWRAEVRKIFKDIASSLRNSSTANDISAAVGYRYKMLLVLQSKINNLKASIDVNKEHYRLYQYAPDVLFSQEMEDDMKKLDRSNEEVSFVYRKFMEKRLSALIQVSPFVDACNLIVDHAEGDFKDEFSSYLPDTLNLSKRKFKAELTVPQLAYFFKILHQKEVISEETKMNLYKTIAENFSTSNSNVLSASSVKNKFEAPEVGTMKYIASLFEQLANIAKKDCQKEQQ